ncbi:hypothetical protein [Methylophaga sp.]|uniref:hypothetical protein n=1 Tax=Methylophaga sp. TaxID=2024840 RepID=UPI002725885A|nr:hypothetical protein [Methylophaga sp.]MDO8827057.1 hypothetical protein [Methylophaga sp.]
MATHQHDTQDIRMINVVVLGRSIPGLINLAVHDDLNITAIEPDTIDDAVLAIKAAKTNITVLEQDNEHINTDLLCLVLATNYPQNQTIILSDKVPDFEQLKATGFRARGYITPSQHDKLVKAIHAVHDGEAWLPRRLVADMLNHFAAGDLG